MGGCYKHMCWSEREFETTKNNAWGFGTITLSSSCDLVESRAILGYDIESLDTKISILHYQNGVVERKNCSLTYITKTMLLVQNFLHLF